MVKAAACLCIVFTFCGPVLAQETTTPVGGMTREARVAAHRQRIEELMAAHRMVQLHAGDQDTSGMLPRVVGATVFDSTIVPALRQAQVSAEQIGQLREINNLLLTLGQEKNTTAPEHAEKVRELLVRQRGVLSAQQQETAFAAYLILGKETRKQSEASVKLQSQQ